MSFNFSSAERDFIALLAWVESWGTTPREKIDLDGMAAIARLAGAIRTTLETPAMAADLAAVRAMIAQDFVAPAAPTPEAPPPLEQAPQHYAGEHGGSIYTGFPPLDP